MTHFGSITAYCLNCSISSMMEASVTGEGNAKSENCAAVRISGSVSKRQEGGEMCGNMKGGMH